MNKGRVRIALALLTACAVAACATTKVTQWAALPGKDVLIGEGGAAETVKQGARDIEIWIEGSPNRPFKILAKVTSTYRYGIADRELARDAAKRQMVEAAIANGGDAVVFGTESAESIGTFYQPGMQSTTVTPVYRGVYHANTVSTAGISGSIGEGTIHAYIVRYEESTPAKERASVEPVARKFAGYWTVTFEGASAGSCANLLIEPSGRISGSCQLLQAASVSGAFTVSGTVNSAGATSLTATTGARMTGTFSTVSGGSGSWANGAATGTWFATRM